MKTFWSIAFSVFFLVVLAASGLYLFNTGRLVTDIPWSDLILLSLATFRLVRLFSYDHITAFLRESVENARPGTFLGMIKDLLGCPWCTGVWFAFLAYFGYALSREAVMPLILVLSIAGIASLLMIFTNLLGWNAEDKKLEVKKAQR